MSHDGHASRTSLRAGPWQAGYPPPPVPMYGAPAAPPKQLPVEPVAVLSRPHVSLPPVSVQQPLLMSTFSYDENKMLHLDDSAKRWYRVPPTKETSAQGADLNYGFERFQDKPHIPDPLDSVLYTLMYRPSAQRPSKEPVMRAPQVPVEALESEVLRAQIITWRGIMTKLCTAWSCHVQAPPMFREGFELNVMMLGDTLIIEEAPPTVQQVMAMQTRPSKSKQALRSTYYGYSFESYCTRDRPGHAPAQVPNAASVSGWGGDVNTNVQWCHIVKTKLGSNRIIMGGEVDCVETLDAATDSEREGTVELKTNLPVVTPEDQTKLDIKMLRIYMQSYLLGVRSVVIGFRDAQGTLLSHQTYRTADLPRLVRGRPGQWNPNDNLAYGANILDFVRQQVRAEMERWCHDFAQQVRVNESKWGPRFWGICRCRRRKTQSETTPYSA
ncbi:unnamed protein product [Malassezia sympodialis ATCC 42132]|uniref:uncharacterized protein n=1 Tax=Malassezia sympodialis (strain ATCC 42132) TaxID=1230383 RepID=UPI0002C22648|nr:uncharacterized protein MSY001_0478 [Malassezia sympodialis ATCC 42132]CCU97772.1 unnamed protein product [Malassezia sympodialis ATCC 42132]|eukprot:XP_018739107.1 uncharacterized protein MSY001_0478 [Malassezia sympodialis ATCC 42132]